jgi:O-glycosyl hydrolase
MGSRRLIFWLTLGLLLLAGSFWIYSVFISTSGKVTTTVTVNSNQVYQTIGGLGGNYTNGRFKGQPEISDSVGRFNLDNLKPAKARVGLPLQAYEPQNDDNDPNHFNWDKFQDNVETHNIFLLLKELQNRGIEITLSIWDVPDWMVSNPDSQNRRKLNNYSEVIESIAAFLIKARNNYGLTIAYLSFNESDTGVNILLSPTEYISFIKQAGAKLDALQLTPKWLIGDVTQPGLEYARQILQDQSVSPYLGPVAFHSWGVGAVSESVLSDIYNLAHQYNKEVWCTEVGYDSDLWRADIKPFSTWENAWLLAQNYYRVLKFSRASVADYWSYENDYPLTATDGTPYPAYYVVKQLAVNLPPGSQIIGANSDNANLWSLAAKKDNYFMLQLINTSSLPMEVKLNGLPDTELNMLRISSGENMKWIGSYKVTSGRLVLQLPSQSISTLTTKQPSWN